MGVGGEVFAKWLSVCGIEVDQPEQQVGRKDGNAPAHNKMTQTLLLSSQDKYTGNNATSNYKRCLKGEERREYWIQSKDLKNDIALSGWVLILSAIQVRLGARESYNITIDKRKKRGEGKQGNLH